MENEVIIWWGILSFITLGNIIVWIYSVILIRRRKPYLLVENYILTCRLLILSGIYVFGCAIRAVLPRIDAQRISLIDHWLSSILVGRSAATIAELCFIAQWALLLHATGKYKNQSFVIHFSYWLLPIIFVAEMFSWTSVVTTINFGHVIEESLWAITAGFILICFVKLHSHTDGVSKNIFSLLISCTVVYLLFMLMVDIPMYYERWQSDVALKRDTLSIADGFRDLTYRWVVVGNWKLWRAEVPWMTLYFSLAVWISIALSYVPVMKEFKRIKIE